MLQNIKYDFTATCINLVIFLGQNINPHPEKAKKRRVAETSVQCDTVI